MSPYKDEQTQREADKFYHKRLRAKRKLEAEARNEKFIEEIPETAENLNYGMKANPEKPLTWDEYSAENPKADKTEWIQYKLEFSSEHKWQAEKEIEDKRRARDEQSKYGTREHDCILWRRFYEQGKKSDFQLNHNGINICLSCSAWVVKQKNRSALDLNDTKEKGHFEELDGYASVFSSPKPDPENFAYGHGGVFPMTKICSICGSQLNEKGKCPVCDSE